MATVSKTDRDFMIKWLEEQINERVNAILDLHQEESEALREKARIMVTQSEVGRDLERYIYLEKTKDNIIQEMYNISDKYNKIMSIHGDRRFGGVRGAAKDEEVRVWQEMLATQGWGVEELREKLKNVRISLMFATTDVMLREAVKHLMDSAGIEEEL